jgi:CelD/BcsL family acetyltransferase involved in cellulose biosynthesis
MKVQVLNDIKDKTLVTEWKKLEEKADIYPQNSFHWVSTWLKYKGKSNTLRVFVISENDVVVAIAPFIIKKSFGIKILHSIPIHFGDYYHVIIVQDTASKAEIYDFLLKELESHCGQFWHWIRFDQITELDNELVRAFKGRKWVFRDLTTCPTARIDYEDWDTYLGELSGSFRSTVRRKLRKYDKSNELTFKAVTSWEEFEPLFPEMIRIHNMRWEDNFIPKKSKREQELWKNAIKGIFQSGKAVFYLIQSGEELVAYRLGFYHNKTYFDWHLSHNPKYNQISPGIVIVALVIKHLMEKGYSRFDFMAGGYDWKKSWCPGRYAPVNYTVTSPSKSLFSLILNWYYHGQRDNLRGIYHKMTNYSLFRKASRILFSLKKKWS